MARFPPRSRLTSQLGGSPLEFLDKTYLQKLGDEATVWW